MEVGAKQQISAKAMEFSRKVTEDQWESILADLTVPSSDDSDFSELYARLWDSMTPYLVTERPLMLALYDFLIFLNSLNVHIQISREPILTTKESEKLIEQGAEVVFRDSPASDPQNALRPREKELLERFYVLRQYIPILFKSTWELELSIPKQNLSRLDQELGIMQQELAGKGVILEQIPSETIEDDGTVWIQVTLSCIVGVLTPGRN